LHPHARYTRRRDLTPTRELRKTVCARTGNRGQDPGPQPSALSTNLLLQPLTSDYLKPAAADSVHYGGVMDNFIRNAFLYGSQDEVCVGGRSAEKGAQCDMNG